MEWPQGLSYAFAKLAFHILGSPIVEGCCSGARDTVSASSSVNWLGRNDNWVGRLVPPGGLAPGRMHAVALPLVVPGEGIAQRVPDWLGNATVETVEIGAHRCIVLICGILLRNLWRGS